MPVYYKLTLLNLSAKDLTSSFRLLGKNIFISTLWVMGYGLITNSIIGIAAD